MWYICIYTGDCPKLFNNSEDKALFSVFDGHGQNGHDVSQFLTIELPKIIGKQQNFDISPHDAITKAFLDCSNKLASGAIDCAFSGSTCITVILAHGKIYSCNAGDSRAVLAKIVPSTNNETKYNAIPLSSDHK